MLKQSNIKQPLGCEFRVMTLKQAGRHLMRLVKGSPGPQDHVRVAELCLTAGSVDEVERAARLRQEYQVDVDDALTAALVTLQEVFAE